jgi:hypothetical protein
MPVKRKYAGPKDWVGAVTPGPAHPLQTMLIRLSPGRDAGEGAAVASQHDVGHRYEGHSFTLGGDVRVSDRRVSLCWSYGSGERTTVK